MNLGFWWRDACPFKKTGKELCVVVNRKLKIKISGDGFVFRNKASLFPFGSMKSGNGRGHLLRAFFQFFGVFILPFSGPKLSFFLKKFWRAEGEAKVLKKAFVSSFSEYFGRKINFGIFFKFQKAPSGKALLSVGGEESKILRKWKIKKKRQSADWSRKACQR